MQLSFTPFLSLWPAYAAGVSGAASRHAIKHPRGRACAHPRKSNNHAKLLSHSRHTSYAELSSKLPSSTIELSAVISISSHVETNRHTLKPSQELSLMTRLVRDYLANPTPRKAIAIIVYARKHPLSLCMCDGTEVSVLRRLGVI